jgi:hypothetical protein
VNQRLKIDLFSVALDDVLVFEADDVMRIARRRRNEPAKLLIGEYMTAVPDAGPAASLEEP